MKHYIYDEDKFNLVDANNNKYTLTVFSDNYPQNPREWDNVATMICWHSSYLLGDKHNYTGAYDLLSEIYRDIYGRDWEDDHDNDNTSDIYSAIVESRQIYITQLYLYDHGGIALYTYRNDLWDSSKVGFAYVWKDTILKECPSVSELDWISKAREIIDNEIETYNYYLQGDVYGFRLSKHVTRQERCPHCGEIIREYEDEKGIDNCSGFYGDSLEDSGILDYIPTGLRIVE